MEYHTQLAKMSFDKMFNLTAEVYFRFYKIYIKQKRANPMACIGIEKKEKNKTDTSRRFQIFFFSRSKQVLVPLSWARGLNRKTTR